ncbi:MAG TPA: DUF3303 family protein [Dehalococcoidia bacterium]|jgi:hypothetical protein|nr:DUF3303 family protein [Dehalococcoidia bacterium]
MLHMLVARHGPETCPASRPEYREKYLPQFAQLADISKKHGVTIEGGWTNMPAHLTYILVEAPDAQAVCNLAADSQLMNWNWVESLLPVITMADAAANAQRRQL